MIEGAAAIAGEVGTDIAALAVNGVTLGAKVAEDALACDGQPCAAVNRKLRFEFTLSPGMPVHKTEYPSILDP